MLKVDETAICSQTDVDAVCQVRVCLTEHDAEENGEQCEGQNASLLDAVGDGEAARQRPIVLHLTLLTFMELAEDGEKFGGTAKARQDFFTVHCGMQSISLCTQQGGKISLFKLPRHHSALHCRQNLGSRLDEQAHPDDSTGKHTRNPVWVKAQQRDRRHDLRAEADKGEMQRTERESICSFRRPDKGL